ncbi:hypothetical protein DBR32_09995 [Taibaiella sp. KBW10]|uniref:YtxH domain-containing protein n=1 Tax=Taibaiella sp. KBW10 TaxID=2153357 RepID=UPI000F59A61C|nr:YtxH domain-containing protein [Taibaiella sp. KBW10]RQO31029.1 hypothetical protein DBR32_09995 [Taibaiella sp. KBW10]
MALSKFSWAAIGGFTLGILFAPSRGANTRRTVANVASGIKSKLDHIFKGKEDELESLRKILADDSVSLSEVDRKKLVQLIENNQKVLKELDA